MLNFKNASIVVLATAALVFVGCSKKKEETQAPAASEASAVQHDMASMPEAAPAAETAPATDTAASAPADEKTDTKAIAALDKPAA